MRAHTRLLTTLTVVLACCIPGYAEILIYDFTTTGREYDRHENTWDVALEDDKGYLMMEVAYDPDGRVSLSQAIYIEYGEGAEGKWFYEAPAAGFDLKIERVDHNGDIEWMFLERDVDATEVHLLTVTGRANESNIGVGEPREVATMLRGYDIELEGTPGAGGDLRCEMEEGTVGLNQKWTRHANDSEKGLGQDFAATVQYVRDYLQKKGYVEVAEYPS